MDKVSRKKRSDIMSRIRSKNTKLECQFRRRLWELGIRYRINPKGYFGKPDLVIRKKKTVIFIDSCFWHGCKKHCRVPVSNNDYWVSKIECNKGRDLVVTKYYKERNWNVVRIWEHDIKQDTKKIVHRIIEVLNGI